jgi:hypothetical protein
MAPRQIYFSPWKVTYKHPTNKIVGNRMEMYAWYEEGNRVIVSAVISEEIGRYSVRRDVVLNNSAPEDLGWPNLLRIKKWIVDKLKEREPEVRFKKPRNDIPFSGLNFKNSVSFLESKELQDAFGFKPAAHKDGV